MVVWFCALLHVSFHMRFDVGRGGWVGGSILGAKDLKALPMHTPIGLHLGKEKFAKRGIGSRASSQGMQTAQGQI